MARITTEMKVGIFVILGLVILIYMTATVGKWNLGRDKGYLVFSRLDSAAGLLQDSPVKVLGVTKGRIESLEIEKDKAKIYMRVPSGLTLPQDSLVFVRSEGLLGEKYIEIKPGTPEQPAVSEGGELLQGAPPADIDVLFTDLSEVAEGIKQLTRMISQPLDSIEASPEKKTALQSMLMNLSETSASLKNLAKRVERGEGTIGKLFSDETIYNDFKIALSELSSTVKKVTSEEGTLGKLLSDEELYTNMKEIATRINTLIKKAEGGEGVVGKLFMGGTVYKSPEETEKKEPAKQPKEEEDATPLTALGSILGEVAQ